MPEVTAVETKWIENHLIPSVMKKRGKSGSRVRSEISFPEHDFFLSFVYFVTLTFESDHASDEKKTSVDTLQLVVKKPRVGMTIVKETHMDRHFHNEILFYTRFARGSQQFPRCVYTAKGAVDDYVVVTESIATIGYEICPDAYDIPFEYTLAAVEELGKLHAMGYAMKQREPEDFRRIIGDIKDARFLDEGSWLKIFLNIIATRPVEWLRKNDCEPEFCDRLEKHFSNAYEEVALELVKPVEPLATLCHGDFTRNNVFFRKTRDRMEAMLFDFAVITYSSPSIDLSTFLYLNASARDRTEKFDVIFGAYHEALMTHLRDAGIRDLDKYSYDKFLADYKRHAIFGYMIAVFFLPVTRGYASCDFEQYSADFVRGAWTLRAAGGEPMTEEFGKMILDFKNNGCLDYLFSHQ